jgi:hypothetical protein
MFDARLVSLSADVDAERHQHRQHSEQDSSVHLASRIGLDRLACRFQQFYLTRPTQACAILSNPDAKRAIPFLRIFNRLMKEPTGMSFRAWIAESGYP